VKAQNMRRIRLIMAIIAIASSAGASLAGDVETVSRNCTWCHGALGRGYSTAPRLAGQRHEYIMNQLYDFRTHARDNPFSQQYMWGATANLGPQTATSPLIFQLFLPRRPMMENGRSRRSDGTYIWKGFRNTTSPPAPPVTAPMVRASDRFPVSEACRIPT